MAKEYTLECRPIDSTKTKFEPTIPVGKYTIELNQIAMTVWSFFVSNDSYYNCDQRLLLSMAVSSPVEAGVGGVTFSKTKFLFDLAPPDLSQLRPIQSTKRKQSSPV